MASLLRGLSRLLGFLLLVVLAVVGLAAAVFCITGSTSGLSLPGLAKIAHLSGLKSEVAKLLTAVESSGSVALLSLLGGLLSMLLGLALLRGVFAVARERLIIAERDREGTLAARKRPLRQLVGWVTESGRGVTRSKVKLRSSRRGSGKLTVTAYRPRNAEDAEVQRTVSEALSPVVSDFKLRDRVRVIAGDKGDRVE